jgi:periplasmic copper chaperone A
MHKIKLVLFSLQILFSCQTFANETIKINDAWISEAPPTVSILAGYAKIQNLSGKEQTLTSVSSPDFYKTELHLSKVIDGMATMEKQTSLEIPAKGSIELTPGSYHLMLFNPKSALKANDKVILNFNFSDGTSIVVEATVKKRMLDGNDHHHHHHDH